MKRLRVKSSAVRARAYDVMQKAVEDGVGWGWNRAHKYEDLPSEETIREKIYEHVMSSICEWFDFEESESK